MDTCPKEAKINEMEEQLQDGALQFQSLSIALAQTKKIAKSTDDTVKEIHRRFFIDNGTKSFQTRVSNQSLQIKCLWAAAFFVVAGMGGLFFAVMKAGLIKGA
jgi:hypothetical protein